MIHLNSQSKFMPRKDWALSVSCTQGCWEPVSHPPPQRPLSQAFLLLPTTGPARPAPASRSLRSLSLCLELPPILTGPEASVPGISDEVPLLRALPVHSL